MATYQTLRDLALNRLELLGNPIAQTVTEDALMEAMKFVNNHAVIPSLIASSTFTIVSTDPENEANAIPLDNTGFNIASTFQAPYRIYVKSTSSTPRYGNEYTYYLYHNFISLLSIPSNDFTITSEYNPINGFELDTRPCTLTPDNKLWLLNVTTGNFVTFFYKKKPAAYNNSNTPEILEKFDHILVSGAEVVLKEWLRESTAITHTWELFTKHLIPQINQYKMEMSGQKKPMSIKLHKSYRV